jgi:hypothetical protein
MKRLGAIVMAGALGASLAPVEAVASAWTRPAGETFLSVAVSTLEPRDADAVREATTSGYVEYGLNDWLTLGGGVEWKIDRELGPYYGESAVSMAAFARFRLREGPAGDPLSIQFGLIAPLREPDPASNLFAERRAIDARVLYGRGFGTAFGDVFASGEAGLRLALEEDDPDEGKIDLTAGWRPFPRGLVLLQSFLTLGWDNGEGDGLDVEEWKLGPSVGYDLGTATLLLGVERSIGGRLAERGTRFQVSVWRQF